MEQQADGHRQASVTPYDQQETVFVGDGTKIPLSLFRTIYDEITGKPESVSKSYDDPFQLSLSDIEQLDFKFNQACAQYHIRSANCAVTIFFVDNTREQFASFAEFKRHNAGQVSPVESLLIKYNFLVVPPKDSKPQSYMISVRLASRLAMHSKMGSSLSFLAPSRIMRIMGHRSAMVEIEYIDYMVARTMLGIIDDWFKVLPRAQTQKKIEWLQERSHFIPRLIRFTIILLSTWATLEALPHFVSATNINLLVFGEFMLYAGLGAYVAYNLGGWSGRWLESSIDKWSYISYIKLNKGDDLEISQAIDKNKQSLTHAGIAFCCAAAVSIATKVVAAVIVAFFHLTP